MNSRSIITLAVAVAIGLGAMKLSQQWLSSGRNRGADDSQEVLVAARDFKEEEVLKPDMVKVTRIVRSAIPPNAFSSYKEVEDRWVRTTMLEGDVLVEKKLGPKGTPPGLVANIPPGMRALAIDVTEQSGVSGFILPGHHVDVVRFENNEKNEVSGETILQDVLVLAAGQLFSRPDERAVQSRTVTLALAPSDVDILVAARARGALSLSLRGVNDHAFIERRKAEPKPDPEAEKRVQLAEAARQKAESDLQSLKELLARKPAEPPAPEPPPAPRIATIYRGVRNVERVRLDLPGVTELAPGELTLTENRTPARLQNGFGTAALGKSTDDDDHDRVAPADKRYKPAGRSPGPGLPCHGHSRRFRFFRFVHGATLMNDLIRVVLVDPKDESRNALQRMLRGIGSIWLSEVLTSFQDAAARADSIAAHVTLVVLDHDPNQAIELMQKLAQSNPGTVILPASFAGDSGLILKAIRAGAREFLPLPAEQTELLETISRLLRGRHESTQSQNQGPRIITVTGAAGGIGCTTVAVNLACSVGSTKEHETILVDLDLMFGGVDAYLDLTPDHTLTHVVQSFDRLDLTLLKRSISRHGSGLYVLPHPTAIQEAAALDPEVLRRLFGLLRAAFSTVVIDASKGLQSSDFSAFELSDVILVVVQLDLLCLRNTSRLLALFREYEGLSERVRLVVNRSDSWECQINPKKAEEILKMPISWSIPNAAKAFQEARLKGQPLCDVARGSRPHQLYLEMARALRPPAASETPKPQRRRFAAFF